MLHFLNPLSYAISTFEWYLCTTEGHKRAEKRDKRIFRTYTSSVKYIYKKEIHYLQLGSGL